MAEQGSSHVVEGGGRKEREEKGRGKRGRREGEGAPAG